MSRELEEEKLKIGVSFTTVISLLVRSREEVDDVSLKSRGVLHDTHFTVKNKNYYPHS